MARYILAKEFVRLKESAGTIFNVSNVKVEISETAKAGSGAILYPSRKMSFSKRLYAARAPSDCGTAVIGVIQNANSEIADELENLFDDKVSAAEIDNLFGNEPAICLQDNDDERITEEDWQKIFGR